MADLSATKAILDWMYSTKLEDIPSGVRELAVWAIYDAIGGMMACSLLSGPHRLVNVIKVVGGSPDCTMIGFPMRTSVVNAALVNGTLGQADEVDAVEFDHLGHHIIATTVGTALAAGQFAGASGKEVIRAVILGREMVKRVNLVAAQAERDGMVTHGQIDASNTIGATVTAGIAMGLPKDQMEIALSLGAMMVCGISPHSRDYQHQGKSFVRGGVGAKNGVLAVLMAKAGYDAPQDIFDGHNGFFHSRIGLERPGPDFLRARDEEFNFGGLVFKRYAAGSPNLVPKQILVELMSKNGLVADDIEEILAEVSPDSFAVMSVPYPTYNGKGMLALAALRGDGVGFREAYQEKTYTDPAALSMRERVRIVERKEWEGRAHLAAVITITTKDGRKFRKEDGYRRMTREELDAKFSQLVTLRAGATKAKELAATLKRLDAMSNVADLMVQLELPQTDIEQV